tara:strand:+ start:20389 stop:21201 length:813 start_codon:yes stop_codon:yes gene_type:complete
MKDSIYCIVFALFLACSGQKNGADGALPPLVITMDTVVIDPGEEILFLNGRLRLSALSEDKKYLYNVNLQEYLIEQINLNSLEFEKNYPFEKEGPNGVGNYVRGFSLIIKDKLFISAYPKDNVLDWQGRKLESIDIIEMIKEYEELDEEDRSNKTISLATDGSQFASLISNYRNKTTFFALINRNNKTFKKFAIPGIEKAKNFEPFLDDGESAMGLGTDRYLIKEGGKLILGTGISSELYVMDKDSDSLRHITFNSQLTLTKKAVPIPLR